MNRDEPASPAMRRDVGNLMAQAAGEAERLVAAVRILVAFSLAAVFLASVLGTAPPDDPMLMRQHLLAGFTMAGYLALGVAAFLRARRGGIGRRLAFALAGGDVLFILLSIALGLDNTHLPPDYAAGLPVLWLVPLILAFGALRYDAAMQLYVLALLLGGIVLVAIASGPFLGSSNAPPPPQLALFFALPPNIMRLVMVLLAGLVLAAASRRTRRLLEAGITETRRRLNLTRYLPPQIAAVLATTDLDELRRGRRQPAAVLFVDIRGFTGRAEGMAPDALSRFLTAFRRHITAAAHAHGGVIDKFVGDAAMIVFGVPEPAPEDAARALRCAEALAAAIAGWSRELEAEGQPPLLIGIGGHYGEVFVGAVGDDARLEYTIVGDVVNIAQRLQDLTREAECTLLASKALIAAAGAEATRDWRVMPAISLRGRRQAIRAFARHFLP